MDWWFIWNMFWPICIKWTICICYITIIKIVFVFFFHINIISLSTDVDIWGCRMCWIILWTTNVVQVRSKDTSIMLNLCLADSDMFWSWTSWNIWGLYLSQHMGCHHLPRPFDLGAGQGATSVALNFGSNHCIVIVMHKHVDVCHDIKLIYIYITIYHHISTYVYIYMYTLKTIIPFFWSNGLDHLFVITALIV